MNNIAALKRASKLSSYKIASLHYFAGSTSLENLPHFLNYLLLNPTQSLFASFLVATSIPRMRHKPILICNRFASNVDLKAADEAINVATLLPSAVNTRAKYRREVCDGKTAG